MGCMFSKCLPDLEDEHLDAKNDVFFPSDNRSYSQLILNNLNDDKFHFIKNEADIDRSINRFDEVIIMSEEDADQLDLILNELLKIRKRYSKTLPSQNSVEPLTGTQENKDKTLELSLVDSSKEAFSPEIPERMTASSPQHKLIKGVKQGTLLLEVEKAHLLSSKLIKKHNLKNPYVFIKVYFDAQAKRIKGSMIGETVEVASFCTSKNSGLLRPEWNEYFEYKFEQHERISEYKVGITLFYERGDGGKDYKVGEEQVFALTSLFDQKMQGKRVDYKDHFLRGVIAKLNVRFQFIYDLDGLKEKILNEVKTKMEKLYKIRERHPVFQYGRKKNESLMNSVERVITDISQSSISSTHDNQEIHYFVVEELG